MKICVADKVGLKHVQDGMRIVSQWINFADFVFIYLNCYI